MQPRDAPSRSHPTVRVATGEEIARADGPLPFDRLDQEDACVWLIAWDDERPIGHARLTLDDPPELQNVWACRNCVAAESLGHSQPRPSGRRSQEGATGYA